MSNIDTLKNKRTHLKRVTTRIENFLCQVNNQTSLFDIRARLEKLETLYDQFQSLDIEMAAQSESFPDREAEYEEFEAKYYRVKSQYTELIDAKLHSNNMEPMNSTTIQHEAMQKFLETQTALLEKLSSIQLTASSNSAATLSQTMSTSATVADVRLPKINVPVFDGKYSEFKSFFDLFSSSIHNNNNLSAAQKFQYLKGLLKEDPANLIRHLQVSDQNYEEALNKLKERYDKPSLVVDSLIETFLKIPKADESQELRKLANVADEVIRGLRAQGPDAEKRDPWLIHLLCKKLDRLTLQAWAEYCGKQPFPSLESFFVFINERCDALERLPSRDEKHSKHPTKVFKTARAYTSTMKQACAVCGQNHHLSYCPTFNRIGTTERIEVIKEKRLCFNCLKPSHTVQGCPSKRLCESCKGRHHSLIHIDRKPSTLPTTLPTMSKEPNTNPQPGSSTASDAMNETVSLAGGSKVKLAESSEVNNFNMLLPTARVFVKDNMGYYQTCNILLDSGCQNTLISEKCAQRLMLVRKPTRIFVNALGNSKAGTTRGTVQLEIQSIHGNETIYIRAYIFHNLTSQLPCTKLTITCWDEIKTLPLADNKFNSPKDIDILIGFDYFFSLIREGTIFKDGDVLAQNTAFGWVICSGCTMDESVTVCNITSQTNCEEDLNKALRLFWEVESLTIKKPSLAAEDKTAEDLYCSTTIRSERYAVRLPFKQTPKLGESYTGALRRLNAMERKFKSNNKIKEAYSEFMNEYLLCGHMELVPKHEINRHTDKVYYLPHHAVLKDTSLTTKLRVVFDGSSKSSNGQSLNDNLLRGPVLQQDLTAVLLRYRRNKFCFAADIKQMFRMIDIQECDRDYQRILWRDSPDEEIRHYRLTTVTYGTTSAPYLAIRTLLQLSEDESERFPLASEALKTCFYVDDCMAGSNTIDGAKRLAEELNQLLTAGGFRLRKWATNESKVLINIPENDKIESMVNIPTDITVCLLGVIWNPVTDCFSYNVKTKDYCINTKRKLLSEISKIFDPLGWISPVIIAVKIIMQKLWLISLEWDDQLPDEIKDRAEQLFCEFYLLNNINIPRIIFSTETNVTYHGFCDASSAAYAAVVYCCKTSADGVVSSNIVMAKTKVAPITMVSIPRLELCAAYLLAQIFEYLMPVLHIEQNQIVCWSDSKTVLAWLSSHPTKWKTFVGHRTGYILDTLPDVKWRYVPTKLNPADCASRGVKSSYLIDNKMWFQGPSFLLKDPTDWPNPVKELKTNEELRLEEQIVLTTTMSTNIIEELNNRISRFTRMVRALAYFYRAYNNFRFKSKNTLPLQVNELRDAENEFFKYYQDSEFADVISSIKKKSPVASKKIKRLSPFLDDHGILRVGGRLNAANLPYDSQHQIILHKASPIAYKIAHDCHLKNLHAGVTLLVATLRQRYWIVGARELAKRVCNKCPVCQRYNAKANDQLMADLPKFRVNAAFPFYEVGCDYAGPIMYKQHNGRKSPTLKSYIAVFVCLVTKAVHLELVTDLSSDAFLAALDRFVARRGLCGHIHSDNGTNFQGAAKKLGEIYKAVTNFKFNNNVSNFLSTKGIQWHFIPPASPHFGGIWESTVKSIKYHLRRTIGQATLKYEELTTLLARIEAILNSRPLVQADSDDLPYISPGHFLIGRPLNALPEIDVTHLKTSASSKWKLIQQLSQYFWTRWSNDYLLSLQPRAKWLNEKPNLQTDDVVLLREDKVPPACWNLARVIETHPGPDGHIRVATIKTATSTFKRPVTKLYPLPKDD